MSDEIGFGGNDLSAGRNKLEFKRVLVVEDNAFVRDLVSRMLLEIGFTKVHTATDGQDALNQILHSIPHVIVSDINMKPMGGLEFLRRMKDHGFEGGARIPIIFLTVHSEPAFIKRAKELGADDFVLKPVTREMLASRVIKALSSVGQPR